MGLAMSMLCLPVGSLIGCCAGLCVHVSSYHSKWTMIAFPSMLLFGLLGLFLPLVILCSKYDETPMSQSLTEGECWSEGGRMPYSGLGVAAGIFIGIGLTGTLWSLCGCLRERNRNALPEEDAEDSNLAIPMS